MFDRCFRCGQEGHSRRNCPQARQHPPAPATPAGRWTPPPAPRNRHAYPADHYLNYACPFCGGGPWQPCVNVGTGKTRSAHEARLTAIRIDTY